MTEQENIEIDESIIEYIIDSIKYKNPLRNLYPNKSWGKTKEEGIFWTKAKIKQPIKQIKT